jgi:hypothetical protein
MKSLPAGKSRDGVNSSFVGHLSWSSPELAAPWAEQISEEHQRKSHMEMIAQNWLRNYRPAAEAWIARASFSDEDRKRLLQPPEN